MSEPMSTTSAAVPAAPTCAYPGCERPPRPATSEVGSKPKYCDLADDQGRPAHTAITAFRARAALDRRAAASRPGQPDDLDRPVTMATVRASELRTGLLSDAAKLVEKLTMAAEQLQAAADPEAAEAQIEAVQAEAAAQVADARGVLAREAQRRQQADADAEEARAAAVEMDEKLQAAEAARDQAEQRAADARAETEQARTDAAERVSAAETARDQAIERAEADKAAAIGEAEARAERAAAEAREAADRCPRRRRPRAGGTAHRAGVPAPRWGPGGAAPAARSRVLTFPPKESCLKV